jgi:hypothetical protein
MWLTSLKMGGGLFSMMTKLGPPLIPPKIWGIYISLRGLTVEIHQKDRKYQSAENRYYAISEYEAIISANCALGCRVLEVQL